MHIATLDQPNGATPRPLDRASQIMDAAHSVSTARLRPQFPEDGVRSLPGFAAFLRPRTQLRSSRELDASPPGPYAYADRFPVHSHSFGRSFGHSYSPRYDMPRSSLRPPSTTAPPYYDPANSPASVSDRSYKAAKHDVHDSPSSKAVRRPYPSSSSSVSSTTVRRTSRYLREVDRRMILQRIENGEKQADLAKEYQVSRAAISNLKQRRRLKEQQANGHVNSHNGDDAASRHSSDESVSSDDRADAVLVYPPGRHSLLASTSSSPSTSRSDPKSAARACQVNVASTARLLTQLQQSEDQDDEKEEEGEDRSGRTSAARVAALRLSRLVLEETLSRLPVRPLEIAADCGRAAVCGVTYARPVCAVAVDGPAAILLDEFRAIEPQCAVGSVTVLKEASEPPSATLTRTPDDLVSSSVLILDLVVSESGDNLLAAIEALVEQGVDYKSIFVATLVGYESGLTRVLEALGDGSASRLVTSRVLPSPSSEPQTESADAELVRRLRGLQPVKS